MVGGEGRARVPKMVLVLGLLSTFVVAVQLQENPTLPGVGPRHGSTDLEELTAPAVDGDCRTIED